MPDAAATDAYRGLAKELLEGRRPEADLPAAVAELPALRNEMLEELAAEARKLSLATPRAGWALAAVADAAARRIPSDPFTRAMAAWHLGCMSNTWVQPLRVGEAISRARSGFVMLGEQAWVAACDWQLNALPWTRPDFSAAAHALEEALVRLAESPLAGYAPQCRLALSYAQLLRGQLEQAMANIEACEATFSGQDDRINLAAAWLNHASYLRRQDRFDEALERLRQVVEVFEGVQDPADEGKAHYQMGLCHLLRADNLPAGILEFKTAIELFRIADLDLWLGLALNNLGASYMLSGQLEPAGEQYDAARQCFARHGVRGLLADNLNDSGKLNVLLGRSSVSVEQFAQAAEINDGLRSPLQAAIATANLGEAYAQLGRYQDALYHMERAIQRLKPLKAYFRLATAEKYMALVWARLEQPAKTHAHLDQATEYYGMADQKALVAGLHIWRANAFFQQGKEAEAIASLRAALATAEEYGMRPQAALARQLLGEALVRAGRGPEAQSLLERAVAESSEMGMLMEQAACMASIGVYQLSVGDPAGAQEAFEEALEISQGAFAEVDWRAHTELGNLADARGDLQAAMAQYTLAMKALRRIRGNFFQPALAGSYLQRPAAAFDRAVWVAARSGPEEALDFIEESKASTLLLRLSSGLTGQREEPRELASSRAEIELLQNKLRALLDEESAIQTALQSKEIRAQLVEKVRGYDELWARLERQRLLQHSAAQGPFRLSSFRKAAQEALGGDWMALDYYLSAEQLTMVMVRPQECAIFACRPSMRFLMALDACDRARRSGASLLPSDLQVLGAQLIPEPIPAHLTPETHLLISPHRRLHHAPWPALLAGAGGQPLVCLCTPSLIPSLQAASALWQRRDGSSPRPHGLLVGVSRFAGLHQDLPLVREEIEMLGKKLGPAGRLLAEEQATWNNLLGLAREDEGLRRFAWLHIASHFFADRQTGRVSSIGLAGGDIWLDQLRDLAPLPRLVTLSACNSNDSFLFEGDERMDLQTTCLIAGANHVVGSSWPVLDSSAAGLISLFYDYYLAGMRPAEATAQAQRQMIRMGEGMAQWGGFVCAGIP